MPPQSPKTEIIREAIQRFKHLPIRTIARYVLYNYGPMFNGDLESIRSAIRFQMGRKGESERAHLSPDKIITRDESQVKLPPTWRKVRLPHKLNPGLWFIMADVHIPYHEPKPLEAAIKYAQDQKVTGILFNGDIQDCEAASYWKSPEKRDFDKEIEALIDFLDFIEQEFPNCEKVYKPGNHEYRLPMYYQTKAPELIGMPLAAFETVLGLEYRNIEYLQHKQIVMMGKLPILHGDEYRNVARTVNPARGLFLKTKSWALCSHCHQTSEHTSRNISGTLLTTWSTGCLCDLNPYYNPYGDWNWGFAIVNTEKNGAFEVVNKRILPNGNVV